MIEEYVLESEWRRVVGSGEEFFYDYGYGC